VRECVCVSVDSASASVASGAEASSTAPPEATALLIVEISDRGAVLATGGIVDLPRVPTGLRRDLFLHGGARPHVLTRRTLGGYCLRLLNGLPGQSDCALE